jgi:type VI protein secretion system component VasF
MTPTFQAATIPVMLDILALSERAAAGTSGPVEVERAALRATFETAAAVCRGPLATEWELASYALAAAADELLIVDITWPGQSWWENHALEVELFGSRRRATEFYARAERASALPTGNALLVFVAANFRSIGRACRHRDPRSAARHRSVVAPRCCGRASRRRLPWRC